MADVAFTTPAPTGARPSRHVPSNGPQEGGPQAEALATPNCPAASVVREHPVWACLSGPGPARRDAFPYPYLCRLHHHPSPARHRLGTLGRLLAIWGGLTPVLVLPWCRDFWPPGGLIGSLGRMVLAVGDVDLPYAAVLVPGLVAAGLGLSLIAFARP